MKLTLRINRLRNVRDNFTLTLNVDVTKILEKKTSTFHILHFKNCISDTNSIILAQFTCKLLEKSGFDKNIIHESLILY